MGLKDNEEINRRLNGAQQDVEDIYGLVEKRVQIVLDDLKNTKEISKDAKRRNGEKIKEEITSIPKKIVNLDIYGAFYSVKNTFKLIKDRIHLVNRKVTGQVYKDSLRENKELNQNNDDMKKEFKELLGNFGKKDIKKEEIIRTTVRK